MVLEYIEKNIPEDAKIIFFGNLNTEAGNKAYKKVIDHRRFQGGYPVTKVSPYGPTDLVHLGTRLCHIDYFLPYPARSKPIGSDN